MSGIEKVSGAEDGGLEPPTTVPVSIKTAGAESTRELDEGEDALAALIRKGPGEEVATPLAAPAPPAQPAEAPVAGSDESALAVPVVVEDDPLDRDPWADIEALDQTWRNQLSEFDRIITDAQGFKRLQQPLDDPEVQLLRRWAQETGTPFTSGPPAASVVPVAVSALPPVPSDQGNVLSFMHQMRETVTGLQRDLMVERQERAEEKKRLLTEQRDERLKRQKAQFSAAALASGAPEDVHDLLFAEASRIRSERPALKDKAVRDVLGALQEKYPSLWRGGAPKPSSPPTPAPPPKGERSLQPRSGRRLPVGDQPPVPRRRAPVEAPATTLNGAAKQFKERAAREL